MNKRKLILNYIAILSLFVVSAAGTFENAALSTIMAAYPSIASATIRLMVTLPSLMSTLAMLIAGKIVGNKISYKAVTLFGSICIAAGGLLPFFYAPSWYFILVCRAVLGIGAGCFSVRNALLSRSVPVEKLASFIGIGSVLGSAVNAAASPIVGSLVSIGWRYAFIMNGIALIPMLLILFFIQEPKKTTAKKEKVKANKLPGKIWIYILIQFVATLVLYPLLSGMSSYMSEIGYSNATIAGYMLSVYTGSGVLVNLFLKRLLRTLKNHTFTVAFASTALGSALLLARINLIMIGAGVLLSGIGFMLLSAYMQVVTGTICDDTNVANGSTMILAGTQAGVFLSSYFIEATAHLPVFDFELLNTYFACMVIYLILLIINIVFNKQLNN